MNPWLVSAPWLAVLIVAPAYFLADQTDILSTAASAMALVINGAR